MATLQTYRRRIARELGQYWDFTATSNSTTSIIECTGFGVKSSIQQDDLYKDWWILRPSAASAADRVRVVKTYSPSAGQITPELAYTNSPYANGTGETIELHAIIEPWTELNNIINVVLNRIMIPVEFVGTPTAEKTRHCLTTVADWLTDPDWIFQLGWLSDSEDRNEVDPFRRPIRGTTTLDGDVVFINHPGITFETSDTLYIRALKPAYFHCRATGGTYGDQDGLSLNTDEAPIAEDWVAAGALVEAWNRYSHVMEATANQRILKDRKDAADWFTELTGKYTKTPQKTMTPLIAWGPRR